MKVKLTLEEHPGPLHLIVSFNLLLVLLSCVLTFFSIQRQQGVIFKLPTSRFELPSNSQVIPLQVNGITHPTFSIQGRKIPPYELMDEIKKLRDRDGLYTVTLHADQSQPTGQIQTIAEEIISLGMECYLIGTPEESTTRQSRELFQMPPESDAEHPSPSSRQ